LEAVKFKFDINFEGAIIRNELSREEIDIITSN